ncbi:hypothetical protein DIE04_19095 [Burkholderia sp. Bp8994]|uniref:NosD domain-containing protein n=1 Tax=Burkholderia sp. Bp8994 TaxID=2184555 RepID=UPI000F59A270|nr:NosD domain-containing protein [Burkholderia sp. Bp8994]RQR94561.1 hypothetical protein DIE04_19095 [Burkholderia sp. Bp8994]
MKKILIAFFALAISGIAFGQTYPTPTYGSTTVIGTSGTAPAVTSSNLKSWMSNGPVISFVDSGRSVDNHEAFLTWGAATLGLGFSNDAYTAWRNALTIGGGYATGITGITSNSGSGSWAHTGPFSISGLATLSGGATVTGSFTATGLVTTADLATQAANTILANATGSVASPAAVAMPSCSGSSNALGWSSGSGPVCNSSINAATLGGATFAAPGPIGSTTPGTGAFTTLTSSSTTTLGATRATSLDNTPIGSTTPSTGAFTTLSSTSPPTVGAATIYPAVASNTALQALSTATTGTVIRLGFNASGDTPPLTYTASTSACSLNSGAGDGGSQVKSADGKCWLAKFPPGGADIRWFGAQTGPSNNSTTAFQNAVAASNDVYVPPGQFYMNATVTGISGVLIHGTWSSVLSPYAAGNVLTITNGNFSTVRDLAFSGNAGLSGSGLVLTTTANTTLDNLLVQSFPVYGVACQGTSGNQSSGVIVKNNALLYNGTADLYFSYCNDFHITGNQMGSNVSSPFTTYGIQLANSGAGQITDNFVWQNATGISLSSSHYNWISRNRITQSQQSGLVISTGNYNHITDNQFYTNSLVTSAGYPDISLTGGNTTMIAANQFYSWDGTAHVNYNLTVDATSSVTTITGNQFSWYLTQPTNISTSAASTVMSGNHPIQNGTSNNVSTGTFTGITTGATGGSGATIYLGNGGASTTESNVYFPISSPSAISCFVVNTSAAPGAGQSYTVTLRKNNASTGLTGTISGGSSFGVNVCANGNWVGVNPSDSVDIQALSSAGAASAVFRYSISLQQ